MKVIAVSWRDLAHPSAGGAEVMIDQLLRGLSARGHEVMLVAGGPVGQRAYEVVDAGGTYAQYLRAPWICATRFGQADVIIDAENGFPYFSPLWRRGPAVCLVHHVHLDQWQTRFPLPVAATCRAIERYVMPAVYRNRPFVAVSRSTAEALRAIGVPGTNIRVIESGVVPLSGPLPQKAKEPLFVSLNRLVPHKRIDLLLESWRVASEVLPGRLVVAGDGPELDDIRSRAASIPRVQVLGRVSDQVKLQLLAEAWAVLSTSHHEGWGMSIMEAATLGTPAIAVDAPGVRDSIVDGVTGVLVRSAENQDLPRAIADAIRTFSADGRLRGDMGEAARTRAAAFGWSRSIDLWEQLLIEVCGPAQWAQGDVSRSRATRSHRTIETVA
jgi:glycosyltransferase involved in cell wall biosynthesis